MSGCFDARLRRLTRIAAAAALVMIGSGAAVLAETLTPEGLGKVRIGMTVSQAEKALGAKLAGEGDTSEACRYVHRAGGADPGVSIMVESGRITRIDVEPPAAGKAAGVTTAGGIGLGASLDEVKRVYGAVKLEGSDSEPDTKLVHVEASKRGGTVLEIRDGKVTSFRSGLKGPIDYSEGCS
jgi:hypothetical protein